MNVLLLILKILGYALLALLGLLLIILLIVLFVPIRYEGRFKEKDAFGADFRLQWFFRFLYVRMKRGCFGNENVLRAFWAYDIPKGEGILELLQKVWKRIRIRVYRILSLLDSGDERAKAGAELFFRELVWIIRGVLPDRLTGDMRYGFGRPDHTGYLTAVLAAAYPVHPDFLITPDFQGKAFELDATVHGRIRIHRVVLHFLKIVLNRDVLYILKMTAENKLKEVAHGS